MADHTETTPQMIAHVNGCPSGCPKEPTRRRYRRCSRVPRPRCATGTGHGHARLSRRHAWVTRGRARVCLGAVEGEQLTRCWWEYLTRVPWKLNRWSKERCTSEKRCVLSHSADWQALLSQAVKRTFQSDRFSFLDLLAQSEYCHQSVYYRPLCSIV